MHLLRTVPAADTATVSTLREAAARASTRGAPSTAAAYLRRALAEPPASAHDDAGLRLGLGLALAADLSAEAPQVLNEAVERADSPSPRSAIALRGARAMGLAGHIGKAVELCQAALADPAGASPEMLTRIEAELVTDAWLQAGTHAEAHQRLRHPVVDPAPLPLWRVNAAMAATLAGRPAAETIALLQPVLDSGALAREEDSLAGTIAALTLVANDELETARRRCEALMDAARPRGWLIALAHGAQLRAMALTRAGRARDAEADARLAFDHKLPATPRPAMLYALHILLDALVELDEPEAAEAALASAGIGDPPPEALARLGDSDGARTLAGQQLDLANRLGTPGACGAALRAAARAAPPDQRITLLQQAVSILSGSPAGLERARAVVDLGAALRRANRRGEAREPLSRALDLAQRGGLRLIARRARDELLAAGARPRRDLLTGPEALTPAEHRIAALAAAGHTNREIAEQLYITLRTVETHLTHAFQKLQITTRAQLADSMTRAGT